METLMAAIATREVRSLYGILVLGKLNSVMESCKSRKFWYNQRFIS